MTDPLPPSDAVPLSQVLQPRSIGDILDTTIRLYRWHFGLYFGIVMIVQAVVFVASQVFQVPMYLLKKRLTMPGADPSEHLPEILMLGVPMGFGLVLLVVVALVGYQFSTGGLVVAVSETFLGRRITIGDAYRAVVSHFWSLFGAGLLSFLAQFAIAMGGVVLIAILVGIGTALDNAVVVAFAVLMGIGVLGVALLATLYVLLSFLLAPQVVMLEHGMAVESLRRSWELMRVRGAGGFLTNNVFRAGVILLIVFVIQMVVTVIVQMPVWIVMAVLAAQNSEAFMAAGTMPLWLQIPSQLIQSVAGALVMPVGIVALILFYYDIRIRFEGFDLHVLSGELET